MKICNFLYILYVVISLILTNNNAFSATYTSADRSLTITASTIQYNESINNIVISATGNVYLKSNNNVDRTFIEVKTKSMKIIVKQNFGKGISGIELIEKADFEGPVSLTYTTADNNNRRTTTNASADNMKYNGMTKLIEMNGNVKIYQYDSVGGSANAVGDKAFYNIKKILNQDEFRFRVESNPGVSRVEVIPPAEN